MRQAVYRAAADIDGSAVADCERIDPIVIDVAVEEFGPATIPGEAELVAEERVVVEARHDDDVETLALDPAVKGDDPIVVVRVVSVDRLAAQSGLIPAQTDEVLGKSQLIAHRFFAGNERAPLEQIGLGGRIVAPLPVFQKFLPHE